MVWKLSPLKRSCFSLYFRIRSAAWNKGLNSLKGPCHEIFDFKLFFMDQFPPSPWVTHEGRFEFFRTSWKYLQLKVQFFHQCRWYRRCTLTCEYLREFSKNFEMILTLFSGAWGKMIHVKSLKQKISWHCPFKTSLIVRKGNTIYAPTERISLKRRHFDSLL